MITPQERLAWFLNLQKKTHNFNENTALKEVERTGTESTDTAL